MKYNKLIIEYSAEYGLDPYLVSAIINVESRYKPDARSHKDAIGLMQVTPPTGRWIAERFGMKNFKEEMLYQPEINIKFGCWYLYSLKQEFNMGSDDSDLVLVLAAYNGGIGNVRKWLSDSKYSTSGMELDHIPFEETRQYVDKVLVNYRIYRWLYPHI